MDTLKLINEYITTPIIIAVGASVLFLVKHFMNKMSNSMIARNEISALEKEMKLRNQIVETVSKAVKAAVASNMQAAEEMKEGGKKLDEFQIEELNDSTRTIILRTLPPSITEEDGSLIQYIGSKEKLNDLIDALIEKYVYEYKQGSYLKGEVESKKVITDPKTRLTEVL